MGGGQGKDEKNYEKKLALVLNGKNEIKSPVRPLFSTFR
jgi:hypothetical protein